MLVLLYGVKLLIFVSCFLFSVLVGIGIAWLSHKPGERKQDAVRVGCYAFGGTLVGSASLLSFFGVL
ncbi:hypothetical protein ACIRPU_26125 [Streptomyces sp. NPDC102259]|uniref:hypothetical protein n=1 Tax=Streptomyces sp. NPDC102259 TaxID=3366148 RepID=UPI00382CBBF6